jgi:hypothetical protein
MFMTRKKEAQLGCPLSTALYKLTKDLLFDLAIKTGHRCFRCGGVLDRESFSIDHKIGWMDSPDPHGMFFDIGNIAYSHLNCNTAAKRTTPRSPCGSVANYNRGCRCALCLEAKKLAKYRWRAKHGKH